MQSTAVFFTATSAPGTYSRYTETLWRPARHVQARYRIAMLLTGSSDPAVVTTCAHDTRRLDRSNNLRTSFVNVSKRTTRC